MAAKDDPRWGTTAPTIKDDGFLDKLAIAMALYHAGGGTIDSLANDWSMNVEEKAEFRALVKEAWDEKKWLDRRTGDGDRRKW